MLTSEGCAARRARLWERVPERIEWLLIADPRHVYYLSNFFVNPLSFSAGERGLLLLERQAGATLLADNFALKSTAGSPFVERVVEEIWYDHKHGVVNRDQALLAATKSIAERVYGRLGAVEAEWLPLAAWEVLGLDRETHTLTSGDGDSNADPAGSVDLGSLLRELRRHKEFDEVALIKQSLRATEAGQARAREAVRAGATEWDLYREVHAAALAAAGQPVVIYGDFRATNAAHPKQGGPPTDYALKNEDLFILDYSVVIDGYRSDITNTLSVGAPNDKQYLLFELCEAAQRAGERVLRPGARASDVYDAVAHPFREAGYGDAFPHHAGHGIGLAHPEPPILVPESHDILQVGDVMTLEPGLYVDGIGGIRIEHNYLITDAGYERLSQHLISLT
jgi:Xaa-Pro aminopeptidase